MLTVSETDGRTDVQLTEYGLTLSPELAAALRAEVVNHAPMIIESSDECLQRSKANQNAKCGLIGLGAAALGGIAGTALGGPLGEFLGGTAGGSLGVLCDWLVDKVCEESSEGCEDTRREQRKYAITKSSACHRRDGPDPLDARASTALADEQAATPRDPTVLWVLARAVANRASAEHVLHAALGHGQRAARLPRDQVPPAVLAVAELGGLTPTILNGPRREVAALPGRSPEEAMDGRRQAGPSRSALRASRRRVPAVTSTHNSAARGGHRPRMSRAALAASTPGPLRLPHPAPARALPAQARAA